MEINHSFNSNKQKQTTIYSRIRKSPSYPEPSNFKLLLNLTNEFIYCHLALLLVDIKSATHLLITGYFWVIQ